MKLPFTTIRFYSTRNGIRVCISTPDERHEFVCQDFDSEPTEVEAFVEMLGAITDVCGPSTSRYSDQRIVIEIRPGDKNDKYDEWAKEEWGWVND